MIATKMNKLSLKMRQISFNLSSCINTPVKTLNFKGFKQSIAEEVVRKKLSIKMKISWSFSFIQRIFILGSTPLADSKN
jgi:hypothetical protein